MPRRVPFMDAVRGTRVRTNLRGGVEVDIPPGIDNGGMIKMPGMGGPPPRQFEGHGEPGDLLLQARRCMPAAPAAPLVCGALCSLTLFLPQVSCAF